MPEIRFRFKKKQTSPLMVSEIKPLQGFFYTHISNLSSSARLIELSPRAKRRDLTCQHGKKTSQTSLTEPPA